MLPQGDTLRKGVEKRLPFSAFLRYLTYISNEGKAYITCRTVKMGNILPFTSDKGQDKAYLLLRLYDGALLSIDEARRQIAVKNYSDKGRHISKAIDILNELSGSLDSRYTLSRRLDSLYLLCTSKLLYASSRMETSPLDSAADILSRLRGAVADALPHRDGKTGRVLTFTTHRMS